MMKKEKKEGNMHKDSLVVEIISGSIKRKKRDIIFQLPSKTKYN